MDIIIIGAGCGGLRAAKVLAESGANVTVFEKCESDVLGYDWRDDVAFGVFPKLGIDIPEGSYKTACVSMIAPFSEKALFLPVDDDNRDWNVERKLLAKQLVDAAVAAGAKIVYGKGVDELIVRSGKVRGVRIENEEIFADLVIDSSGVNSKFRGMLPENTGITANVSKNDMFNVYRAYFNLRAGEKLPEKDKWKSYLKHLGIKGIAWCAVTEDGYADVLVGSVGDLDDKTLERSLKDIRKNNKFVGDDVIRGGIKTHIPVRYPLPVMVVDGYVVIGDAACMTIPMIGSGIANSLMAGQILGDVINDAENVTIETLWKYNVRYIKEIGNEHFLVDCLKRMLLVCNNEDLRYMLECGVVSDEEIKAIAGGEAFTLTPASLLDKAGKGIKKFGFLMQFAKSIVKGVLAQQTAKSIPEMYDKEKIMKWKQSVEKYFK